MEKLKVGFARTDITPELGVRLGGYGVRERPAEEILDRLHATAVVLEQGGLAAVLVNLDWICVEEDVVARVRGEVNRRTGIPVQNVTVCATHSHSVPNTLNFRGWGEVEQAYVEAALPEIVRAVVEARGKVIPARVGFGVTESRAGVNRRGVREDGGLNFTADPHGSFDPCLTVAHFRDEAGADLGIVVHYGAHGTAMGNNRLVSRDWCGVMKDRIESQFPVPVAFFNGAIGDVGPRTNFLRAGGLCAGAGDGVHAVREVGYRAATDALEALVSIREWRACLELAVLTEDVFLPYAPLPPRAEAERELARWEPRKDKWGAPMCEYYYHKAVLDAHEQPPLAGRSFTQTVTALGPLAIVPMPGEMFAGISLRIRAASPYQHTLCCSVSNGSLSYLPTREARHRGGYETWVGRAGGAYLLADNIDDVLVTENLKLLRKLAARGGR